MRYQSSMSFVEEKLMHPWPRGRRGSTWTFKKKTKKAAERNNSFCMCKSEPCFFIRTIRVVFYVTKNCSAIIPGKRY